MTLEARVRTEPHPTFRVILRMTSPPRALVFREPCARCALRNGAYLCLLGGDFHARPISNHQGCTFPSFGNNGIHYL